MTKKHIARAATLLEVVAEFITENRGCKNGRNYEDEDEDNAEGLRADCIAAAKNLRQLIAKRK